MSELRGKVHNETPFQRIAFGSCFNPNRGDDMWDLIKSVSPNQLLLLGDQIYADFHPKTGIWQNSNPEIIRKEYEKFFSLSGWKSLKTNLSHGWMATYDDHDYGINNGDKTWKYRQEAMDYFREFNKDHFTPVPHFDESGKEHYDGVYSSKNFSVTMPTGKIFQYTVILLDSRSNKDPKGTVNGDFLGDRQWSWLEQELDRAAKSSNLIVLGSSIQVIPDSKLLEELWSEFPAARQRLLTLVAKASLQTNIVFLSGDIHSAELSQTNCEISLKAKVNTEVAEEERIQSVTRRLLEFTSSGLSHTFTHRMDIQKIHAVNKLKKAQRVAGTVVPFHNHLPSLVYSRGYIAELLFNVYQVAHPSSHRHNHYGDLYQNLHFGTLDFYAPLSQNDFMDEEASYDSVNRLWDGTIADLEWRTINYEGKTVMHKRIPLYDTFQPQQSPYLNLSNYDVTGVTCINIQGATPLWRSVLERMTLTLFVMVVFIIPICAIIWFVGASIFYLGWGKELKRRQEIEDRYKQLNKAKQH